MASPPELARPIADEHLTLALREGSVEHLRDGLVALLARQGDDGEVSDWRDLILDLAPYHDCARRIGVDPRVLFEWVARRLPPEVQGTVRALGAREDVPPQEFGFTVVEDSDGPRYYWLR